MIIFICVACSEEVICNETNYPREKFPRPEEKHFSLGLGVCEVKLIHDNVSWLVKTPFQENSCRFLSQCLLLSALSYFSTETEIVNKQRDKVESNRA